MSGVCLGTAYLHSTSVHHVLLETIEQNLSDEVFNEEIQSESLDLSVFFQAILRCFARQKRLSLSHQSGTMMFGSLLSQNVEQL